MKKSIIISWVLLLTILLSSCTTGTVVSESESESDELSETIEKIITETLADTEDDTADETENESVSESEQITETDADKETESEKATETETEKATESESVTETETEKETESETVLDNSGANWAIECGIIDEDKYSPDSIIKRGEFATYFMAFAENIGMNVERCKNITEAVGDVTKNSEYIDGCYFVVFEEIMSLDDSGKFYPQDNITKDAVYSALYEFYYGWGNAKYVGGDEMPSFGLSGEGSISQKEFFSILKNYYEFCIDNFEFASYIHKGVNIDQYFNGYCRCSSDGTMTKSNKRKIMNLVTNDELYEVIWEFGFDHLRIPMFVYDQIYFDSDGNVHLSEDCFECFTAMIETARNHGLRAVLDFHCVQVDSDDDYDINTNPEDFHDVFVEVWGLVAENYKDYDSDWLAYELLNEPTNKFSNDNLDENGKVIRKKPRGALWNQYQHDAYDSIRAVDTTKTIAFATVNCNLIDSAKLLDISYADDDPLTILSIHHYVPHDFTMIYGDYETFSDDIKGAVVDKIELMATYQEKLDILIWMSEFGVWRSRNDEAKAQYYSAVSEAVRENDIAYCLWDLDPFSDAFDDDTTSFKDFVNSLFDY